VTVEDNDPPTLTCPTDFTIPLTDQCEYVLEDFTQIIIAADNCGNQQTITVTQSPAPGLVMVDGDVQTVVITATDQNGNSATCSFDVSVLDAVDPTVSCGNIDIDSVKADVNCEFEILDYTAGVTVSDNCTDSADFTITQSPAPGTIANGSSGLVTVTVTVTGPDGFQSVCYTDLVVECTEELTIPNGFSPNGDGINDFFVIEGIEAYPNNNIKIFNRWGNLVYQRDRYQNDWDGTASSGTAVVGAGERLPPGTYFYIFNPGLEDEDPIQGYIYLNQ
jgi:gliding motility-associated-like protein